MENQRLKVGITGAGGNIGTTLAKGFAGRYDLVLYDSQEIDAPVATRTARVDLANREEVGHLFDGLDALIHLAGDPRPNAPPSSTLRNNFAATSYVFEEAKRAGLKKVVFASSNFYHEGDIRSALQKGERFSIALDRNPTPLCLYGESKVFGENVGRHLSHFGVQFAALRIGWTVPEDNPALYGGAYMRAVFCSQRDLVDFFVKALEIDRDFLVAFAVSDNARGVFDLTETKNLLGFTPRDNAENYF